MIWTFLSHLPWFWEKFEIEGRTILWNCNLFQEDNEPIRTLFYTNNTSNEGKFEKYCSFKTNSKLNLKKRKEILRYRVNGNWICIKIFIQMWKRCISIPKVFSQQKYWYFSRIFDNNMLHVAKLFRFCGKLFDKQCFLRAYFKDNLETSI